MRQWPAWTWALIGAVAVVVLLGVTGQLPSIPPIDRLLNPSARNYWETPDGYLQQVFDFCVNQASLSGRSEAEVDRLFRSCYDHSIDGALERGYVTRDQVGSFDPDP